LSDAYQAAIISGTSMYFMPSMGERVNNPLALRLQLLRTLAAATGATAVLALMIFVLREPIVRLVFSAQFHRVSSLMPLQLLGDVLKIAGWILSMSLVAVVRTRAFVTVTVLAACTFVGATKALVPSLGLEGVMWAYLATGLVQVGLGLFLLRDIVLPRRTPQATVLPASPP
jgi:O-antigen/teichoic acid export membrane protein